MIQYKYRINSIGWVVPWWSTRVRFNCTLPPPPPTPRCRHPCPPAVLLSCWEHVVHPSALRPGRQPDRKGILGASRGGIPRWRQKRFGSSSSRSRTREWREKHANGGGKGTWWRYYGNDATWGRGHVPLRRFREVPRGGQWAEGESPLMCVLRSIDYNVKNATKVEVWLRAAFVAR